MARRPALIKLKKHKNKKTRTEQYVINHKAYGDEPVYTSKELTQIQMTNCYNWYNAMCDGKEAKEYLVTYLKNTNRNAELKAVRSIPDKLIPSTLGWIARIRSQGGMVPESTTKYFDRTLQTAISDGQRRALEGQKDTSGDIPKEPAKPSVQDRMKGQLEGFINHLEIMVDNFITTWEPGFVMYDWLQANEISQVHANKLHEYYNPQLLEIEAAYLSKDREGYIGYSGDRLKKLFGFFVMIVEDLEQYSQNKKVVRKARKPKPISTEKKLKDFKYKEFDNDLKLQSVSPGGIIGAAELWALNTKYNQLTVFRMDDPQVGLDVHRTAITKFDPKNSMTKKLRANQVNDIIKQVQSAGKVALRKIMENVKGSDQKLQQRMNENTVLIRIVPR